MTDEQVESWHQLRELIIPSVEAIPAPEPVKAQVRRALTDLVDECERLQTKADRIERWAKTNAYTADPDWYGLSSILRSTEA